MIEIPYDSMDKETLRNLIEEIVTRDGTDYGEVELSTAEKVSQVLVSLQSRKAKLMFDEASESCSLVGVD